MFNRVSQILNARWLIHQEVILNYLPVFFSFLNGARIDIQGQEDNIDIRKPYVVSASETQINLVDRYDMESGDVPANSIAIIPIRGEIMSWHSMDLARYISMAEQDPKIIGVVFLVNSPGGMIFYIDIVAAAIKAMTKPAVSFVMNMAASAALWLVSATDKIILSSPLDRVGSIGTMASIYDFTRLFKDKLGIDIYEIYADAAVNKNNEMRTLLNQTLTMEERTAPIRDDLNFINDFFHQAISDNLNIDRSSEVFSGKVYYAQKAIELGLAHEINTFEYAVNLAHQLGTINQFIKLNP